MLCLHMERAFSWLLGRRNGWLWENSEGLAGRGRCCRVSDGLLLSVWGFEAIV